MWMDRLCNDYAPTEGRVNPFLQRMETATLTGLPGSAVGRGSSRDYVRLRDIAQTERAL
jgi:hypothetical protein